jgi:hypothetical protein
MLERVKLVTSNADVSTKLDPYTKVSYSTYVCTSHSGRGRGQAWEWACRLRHPSLHRATRVFMSLTNSQYI